MALHMHPIGEPGRVVVCTHRRDWSGGGMHNTEEGGWVDGGMRPKGESGRVIIGIPQKRVGGWGGAYVPSQVSLGSWWYASHR